jgi:hypothetical protein
VPEKSLPLSALLSFASVAFTIEFDNEAERQLQHRMTSAESKACGPWLVSLTMYSNCMRLVDETGIGMDELQRHCRVKMSLHGMQRWGYLTVDSKSGIVRATRAGLRARTIWQPLFATIERRWEERFGKETVEELRAALQAITDGIPVSLPQALPILGYGLLNPKPSAREETQRVESELLPLSALLAQPLLAFALGYESDADLSLAIGANVLRLTDDENAVRVRDLPGLSGTSKEGLAMALSFLSKRGYATIATEGGTRMLRLTAKGKEARAGYHRRLAATEKKWNERFGTPASSRLRLALEQIAARDGAPSPELMQSLEPHPENWRAARTKPQTLPHFPMVLHRGGYPDGS